VAHPGLDPIEQFDVTRLASFSLGKVDLSFTNVSLFMVLTVVIASAFLYMTSSGRRLVPTRMQSVSEMCYEFMAGTLRDATGPKGMRYFPLVFSLFVFILVANCISLFPYFYTVNAQIVITSSFALLVIFTVIICGFYNNGFKFLRIFVPSGIPVALVPLIAVIEFLSFLSRPLSLSIRLFANMMAGHIAWEVFAGFIILLSTSLGVFGMGISILPLLLCVAIAALEVLVAAIQAYVFAILTCIYLNDTLHPVH